MSFTYKDEPVAFIPDCPSHPQSTGLTKREYFAAMVLHGLSSAGSPMHVDAQIAVKMADFLIEELNK